ncbi:conserved hypothetical protein [Methylocella silvestris BL2]|uniref:Uncharacterized protein n=1 Tax=Methylocella silvestris (strain DSM 15510 / CIP 108128 / LMG 27833 / NCIMB 13906 / BL2) TaxID=395965 RepID=B8ES47_METSB|nr:hypothetical protein [Methylocella silvestris]ACK52262.1 conserved hypothetical protein [Methylocella silvestris BL2]
MFKIALVAFLPTAAVLFGLMSIGLALSPTLLHHFDLAFGSYMAVAAASFVLALPIAWLVARRMIVRRDKQVLDAREGKMV